MHLWRRVKALMNDENNRNVKGKLETANHVSRTEGNQKGKVKEEVNSWKREKCTGQFYGRGKDIPGNRLASKI